MSKPKTSLLTRIRSLPLHHRLILPFLFLAFFGTFSLVWVAIVSQNKIIGQQEEQRLADSYHAFLRNIDLRGRWAVSLAETFARNPQIAAALAKRDRMRLIRLCYPAYRFMADQYGLSQFHFQTVPGRSFLRLHRLYDFGDLLGAHRQQVRDVLAQGQAVYGLEKGLTGYGIRGVAPVNWQGHLVGTVDLGFAFGPIFLEEVKKESNVELTVLVPDNESATHFVSLATTRTAMNPAESPIYAKVFQDGTPRLSIRDLAGTPFALWTGVIRNYRGDTVALVELGVNRSDTLRVITRYRRWMLLLGIIGMSVSVWAIYVVSCLFTRPITQMASLAREIATGRQVQRIDTIPSGELGMLAEALNDMLSSLARSKQQISEYANSLERRVEVRTRALKESEEKYRTLVESLPLVVYRLLGDGRTIFINGFIEDLMGVAPAAVMSDRQFWKDKVFPEDRERIWPLMDRCLEAGEEFQAEYRVRHRNGKTVFVFDHALPILDEAGAVEVVDGILVNVSDRYRLQQQILQTEELRTLSEISARLAHEIRNPLAVAGGFARRLLHKLPREDGNRKKVEIILKEVARLEKLLAKSLAYLRPFELAPVRTDLNDLVEAVIQDHRGLFQQHQALWRVELAENLEPLLLDRKLFKRALAAILRAALSYCKPAESLLDFRTSPGENSLHLEILIQGMQLSDDDIDHFFYPFTSRAEESESMELPAAKMIIHKHQGVLRMDRKSSDEVLLTISLPVTREGFPVMPTPRDIRV